MQQRAAIALLAVVAIASTTGCFRKKKPTTNPWGDASLTSGSYSSSSSSSDKAPPTPAVMTPTWNEGGTLTIPELKGFTAHASIKATAVSLSFNPPKGARIEVDGKTLVAPSASIDIAPAIGGLSPKDAFGYTVAIDPKKTLHFVFADGKTLDVALPSLKPYDMAHSLAEATKNGQSTSFGAGDDVAPKQHTAVVLDDFDHTVVGPGKTMKDVDWYVVREAQDARETKKKCDGYKSYTKNDGEHTYPLELVDSKVTIVNRRTGETVDERLFVAKSSCPWTASNGHAQSTVGTSEVVGWLRTRRTKN